MNPPVNNLILYQFSRSKVERVDFTHFLSLYAPENLPTGRRLREMMNSMVFAVDGYNDDPREIQIIPEVRRFYSALHDAWPYWLYFCNLDQDALKTVVLCCMNSLATLKVDGRPDCATEYDRLELLRFIGRDFAPMNLMCERAGMFERLIYERTKAVFEYFDLPFDAAPPG